MRTLTIFYDPCCGLCSKFRAWMDAQPKRVHVEFLGYDSPEAQRKFPGLSALQADREVIVLADDGRWWQGASAWVTCLWATHSHYEWAQRLSSPALLPFVRKAVHLISENRLGLSRLLGMRSDGDLAEGIRTLPEPVCLEGTCAITHNTLFTS